MKENDIASNHQFLKPIERIRLVIAPGERKDDPELERMHASGPRAQLNL